MVDFVVLSQPRSGSTLLTSSLNSHRLIACAPELLNVKWCGQGQPDNHQEFCPTRRGFLSYPSAAEYLMDSIYASLLPVRGFKLHPAQGRETPVQDARQFLRDRKVKVIHLRRDPLDQYLSQKTAEVTKQYVIRSESQRVKNPPTLRINVAEMLMRFRWYDYYYEQNIKDFEGCDQITTHYEDLVGQYEIETARLQGFLGVPYERLIPGCVKLEVRDRRAIVENYDEVMRAIRR